MRLFRQPPSTWDHLGFFALALVIHGALLLLPVKDWQNHQTAVEQPSQSLNVHLRIPAETPSEVVEPPPEALAETEEPSLPRLEQKRPAVDHTLAELPPPADNLLPDNQQASDTPPSQTLSTQALRQWVEQADEVVPSQQANRTLGKARSYQPPANWDRNAGTAFYSSFDDRSHEVTLPSEVTVVDRWQAADGSHQVMVQLPNGDSLCGRAAAYNPMQPLVEHVMMFTTCGSKPTFTMPERFNKGR